ncbi:MAG: FAD-dependent monooxygenase [Pseudomonadota bacterium]
MAENKEYDILIAGGGLAGVTLALAAGRLGKSVCLCAPEVASDNRTTALLNDSVEFLETLDIWNELSKHVHPLKTMRILDGTSRLFRIQQTDFHAKEIGLEAFGYNIRNRDFLSEVGIKLEDQTNVDVFQGQLESLDLKGNLILAKVSDATGNSSIVHAKFIVGADGRNSVIRAHFGHGERKWAYPQTALVVDFEHEYPTGSASTEFHTETGPFTIVPQSSRTAGLVWLEKPEEAERLKSLAIPDLETVLEEKMQSFLGKIKIEKPAQTFPISGLTARCFGDTHHALIGEAAHLFPPIGAQGFNLGIRDIRDLIKVFGGNTDNQNPGREYNALRSSDIQSRTIGVDMLNRSLLSDFLPVQLVRSIGIFALKKVPILRKRAMKLGISPIFHG